jgi:hypothetical protein
LKDLHQALAESPEVDDQTRELLRALTADLQRLMQSDGDWSDRQVQPISTQFREMLLRFETKHPRITGLLGEIADSLSNLGI